MDLHYLEIFYEVAKAKSFTKAANELYINQSAVSIQVKKFEELLNTKLFDRSSKKIKLTYTGEALYKMAEEIFDKVKRAEKEISKIIDLDRARLSIGASPVIAEPLLPRLMKGFSKAHEEIEYDLQVSEKDNLLRMLKEGDLDVLIIDEEHINNPNLEVITIEKVPYVLVSKKEYDNIQEIARDPLITRKYVPNNNQAISILEEKHRVIFNEKIPVLGNLSVIKGMVKEEIANAILPYYAVYREIQEGEYGTVYKIPEVKDAYQVVITKDKKGLIQIIKFLNFIQDYRLQY